jgi:hypothetical protein
MWACLEPCPLPEITSFVEDSSRSRKSVFQLFKSHTSFSELRRIEGTGHVNMQAAIFAGSSSRPFWAGMSWFKNTSVPCSYFDFAPSGNGVLTRPPNTEG